MLQVFLISIMLLLGGCFKHGHGHSHIKHGHKSHKEKQSPQLQSEAPTAPEQNAPKDGKKKSDGIKFRDFDYDPAGPYSPDQSGSQGGAPAPVHGPAHAGAAAPAGDSDSAAPSGWTFW